MRTTKTKRIGNVQVAVLTPEQIDKLKAYEKEMGVILIAYRRDKDGKVSG